MSVDAENFSAPWPAVLVDMKDFIDLCFLARGRKPSAITVSISKALVRDTELQPHMRDFRAALPRSPSCRVQLKGTEDPMHHIRIEYGN